MAEIITVENFKTKAQKEFVENTGYLLQKFYPGYMWGVRLLQEDPIMVGFILGELIQFGDNHVMVVNPNDYAIVDEFEKIVKKLGGELLERANLHRGGKLSDDIVTKRPDGFDPRFDETIRLSKIKIKG
jgi:hypothetical protein